jgi:hypothetical protein
MHGSRAEGRTSGSRWQPVANRAPPSPLRMLGAQMVHSFALLLCAAAASAFVGGMPQLAIAMGVVVVLRGGAGEGESPGLGFRS